MKYVRTGYAVMFIALTLVLATAGCKKDNDDTDTSPVAGTWQSADNNTYLRYIIFRADGSLSRLESNTINVRSLSTDVYSIDDKYLSYSHDGGSAGLFEYTISNDTLYTRNTQEVHTYVKATVDETTWVKNVTILQSQNLGVGGYMGSVEWDGYDFLVLNPYLKKMYRINGANFNIYDSVTFANTVTTVACKSIEPWVNYYNIDNKLHKISGVTGTEILSSAAAPAKPFSMASTFEGFLVLTNTSEFYSYNSSSDNFTLLHGPMPLLNSLSLPPDMLVKDGYAYITYFSVLFKLDLTTFQAVETYRFNQADGVLLGITWDGTDIWTLHATPTTSLFEGQVYLRKIQL